MTSRARAWAPALLWAAIIFALSSRSTLPTGLGGGLDKVAHFGAYAVLGALLAHGALAWGLRLGWPLVLGLAYAASDEFHQSFVPGRHSDVADWLADALGVAAGCLFMYRRRALRQRSSAENRTPADPAHR